MSESPLAIQSADIVLLLAITLTIALISQRLRLPYTLILVVVGLVLGFIHILPRLHLSPDTVLYIFLPALLFEGAWSVDFAALRADWVPIFVLAVPGLFMSLGIVAVVVHWGVGLAWLLALLVGSMISPTDPVAVIALMRQLGVPDRLRSIVEGESLFNDGMSTTSFTIILEILLDQIGHQPAPAVWLIVLQSFWLPAGGIALGALVGFIAVRLSRRIDDFLIETTLTFSVAYGVYVLGEVLDTSGLLAVVTAGLMMGTYGRRVGMSSQVSVMAGHTWEFAGYIANSLLFLLLGIQIGAENFPSELPAIGWTVLGVIVGRVAMIYAFLPAAGVVMRRLSRRWGIGHFTPIPRSWNPLLLLSGLRGALSLALVLSLPSAVPQLTLLKYVVYGVVLITLIGQGMSLRVVLPRWQIEAGV
jgi:monovalent cation:H+ antiporter, CPA1 family